MVKFYVTHIITEPKPEKFKGLKRIPWMTTSNYPKNTDFHMGYDMVQTFSIGAINHNLKQGIIKEVYNPHIMTLDQGLWIDQDKNLWVADYHNPYGNHDRINIGKIK